MITSAQHTEINDEVLGLHAGVQWGAQMDAATSAHRAWQPRRGRMSPRIRPRDVPRRQSIRCAGMRPLAGQRSRHPRRGHPKPTQEDGVAERPLGMGRSLCISAAADRRRMRRMEMTNKIECYAEMEIDGAAADWIKYIRD